MDESLRTQLAQLFRLSLNSSDDLVHLLEHGPPTSGLDPTLIRRIIQAILWHRSFLPTYYAVVFVIVTVFFTHELYKSHTRRWRKKRNYQGVAQDISLNTSTTVSSSSSSSTLHGTSTPPQKDNSTSEITPLLSEIKSLPRRPSLSDRFKAFLQYQPRPIYALTSRVNVLPNNATTVSIIMFATINLFYLFYRTPLSIELIFVLADRAGLLFVINLPILYILAAKTNQPIKFLTRRSYEGLNLFHRRLGEWLTIFSVIHLVGMLIVFNQIFRPLGYTFFRYISSPTVYLGLLAIASYMVIYVTSTGWFRHMYYEAFLGLHIVFQFAALTFLFFHYPTAKPYVVATVSIWAVDRILWRSMLSNRKFVATLEVAPDEKTTLIHCEIDMHKKLLGTRIGLHHGWQPGQHVFLTIPSIGWKHRFQTHPFTIASPAPPQRTHVDSWPLQLVIRSIDGFSLDLLNYARHHQHCEVILEGPHGGLEALEAAHDADRVCFIAGGSGIAVTNPLAWDHQVQPHHQPNAITDLRTVYRDGQKHTPTVIECGSVVDNEKFSHFWVRQDPRHSRWISLVPKVGAVRGAGLREGFDMKPLPNEEEEDTVTTSLITHTFDTRRAGPDGGRPDMKTEVWNWVTSPPSSATATPGDSESETCSLASTKTPARTLQERMKDKICIVVSGPDGLVRDVNNVAAQLVREGWNIEVWVEKFGW
ncbi:hypothetical protein B0A52_08667 [Exophiala mesophila]|uniref:FAD-binding FR-type domain-containing protein n=1 Tax=Exophiala mesophila TaxID=212818 RepID=A0A438MYV2_EXOME|nr:hypothetical protein B0A52_08667 [Exophiala mesophila]